MGITLIKKVFLQLTAIEFMARNRSENIDADPRCDDLFVFLRAAAMIEQGESLTSVAKKLEVSTSTLSLLLNRIADAFPQAQLFTRKPGATGGTELTDRGKKLLGTVRDAFQKLRDQRSRLAVVCSQSLVTNQIISPVIAELLGGSDGEHVNFRLRLETNLRFRQLIRMILEREIDLGFCWGSTQRLKPVGGVEITPLTEHLFDLIFIAHDKSIVAILNEILDRFNNTNGSPADREREHSECLSQIAKCIRHLSVAMLEVESQPLIEVLPNPDSYEGRNSMQVDTFDAAIAIVRSKVTDIALIPGFYSSLSRLRELGQIYFSKPVDTIPVAIVSPLSIGLSEPAKHLVNRLKKHLSEFPRQRPDLLDVSMDLPNLGDCRKLKYGYFITETRAQERRRAAHRFPGCGRVSSGPIPRIARRTN